MGKTYKDREKVGRPRVPEWARPRPTRPHRDDREREMEEWIQQEIEAEKEWHDAKED